MRGTQKAGGVRALVPETQTPSIQSTFHHGNKRCRAKRPDTLSRHKGVGGGSCQPNQAAELLSWGPALQRHLVPGPLTQRPRVLPHGPPSLGHRWEWEAEHIVEISGDRPPFAGAYNPLYTQNTDEGKAQLLKVNTHKQSDMHIGSHAHPQMHSEQEIDEGIQTARHMDKYVYVGSAINIHREGWWGGWLQQSFQAVKEKSTEALEFIKRDLTEFSTVVQHDTTCSFVATATAVRNKLAVEGSSETSEKVKKSLSSFLGVITDTLAPPPDKTIDCDVITLMATPSGTTEIYDSCKARLYSLQADPATYCNEPDGPPEQFDNWLCSFSLEDKKGEISEHLVSSPSIRALYTKMVPAAVAHSEFWQRYFYRVFQLDQEEARRVALKQRAEQSTHTESLGWEEEEEEDDFLGATSSSSHLDFTPPLDHSFTHLPATSTPPTGSFLLSPVMSPSEERDTTLSVSSDSVSLPTQVEVRPEPVAAELSEKLTEASLEDAVDKTQEEQRPGKSDLPPEAPVEAVTHPEVRVDETQVPAPAPPPKPEAAKEEGPQDLRVFELNSDSGKSTPSNNGKKGSSTDVSEDWEKDFDLDMTEEEVQMALSKIEASGEVDEDWENWE
ncbi:hypothetical protein KUCAC02_025683 [Chaenocephalus aceratus]|uniref:Uncharacterized protein n=1 Tax=Chaenocephalus aceratus TaxID=36190 RepID=A0ACB9VW32_CHAAC|nr:hypothetical protein KUCAC02_025683 [Chaenocephalus aceratus]